MTHRPFLQITLSARPLGLERRRNVTMQRSDARPTAPGSAAQILEKEEETEPVRAQAEAQAGAGAGEPVAAQRRGKRKSEAADAPAKRVRT
jgi:hypothetical protein